GSSKAYKKLEDKDQGHDQSINNSAMNIRRVDTRRNDCKGSKCGSKATIRVSLIVNTISMKYMKEKRLISNQGDKIAKFVILEHTTFDKNVLNKDCVNVRCIKSELMKSGDVDYLKKMNRIVNDENSISYSQKADHGDAIEKLEICNCDIGHDE
ncbi:24684_t:CDS:2, partial [Gigaspora margarita]